jgi:hypothetical protein
LFADADHGSINQVTDLDFGLAVVGQAHIYEFLVQESADYFLATVHFRPSGKITAKFKSAEFPEIRMVG